MCIIMAACPGQEGLLAEALYFLTCSLGFRVCNVTPCFELIDCGASGWD